MTLDEQRTTMADIRREVERMERCRRIDGHVLSAVLYAGWVAALYEIDASLADLARVRRIGGVRRDG